MISTQKVINCLLLKKIKYKQHLCKTLISLIHHFHIDHNALCLPPKVCITIVFDFSWDDCDTLEKLETMVMRNFRG